MNLSEAFKTNWEKKAFLKANSTVLLAVSGGIDSMVMVHLFRQAGIPIAIAHCNYQLRGEDSVLDEQLIANWANTHNVLFYHTTFETKAICEEWKKGIQETARILRYEWLESIRTENNYSKIATAHHANDNAETLLMNLFKGTGISGLHGIKEKNGNIIRPMLFATKSEIADYGIEHNVPYREDASNNTNYYLRNAVRHKLIPIANELFPNVVEKLNESIKRFSQIEKIYKKSIEQQRKKLLEKRGNDHYIPILKLQKTQELETICYELFKPFDFTSDQVPEIIKLLKADSGKYISSHSHRIIRDRNFLIVTTIKTTGTDRILIEGLPCDIHTEHAHFHFSIIDKPKEVSTEATVALIDMKRISFPLTLRKWQAGDYFYPIGMNMKKKKLSKLFKDEKLALHVKERTWILECEKRVAWVAGIRMDERFKITDNNTAQILRVEMRIS